MSESDHLDMKQYALTGVVLIVTYFAVTLLSKRLKEAKYDKIVLRNNGVEAHISSLGGIIHKLVISTVSGQKVDVALGHATLTEYLVNLVSHPLSTMIINVSFRTNSADMASTILDKHFLLILLFLLCSETMPNQQHSHVKSDPNRQN